ncbi:MAG: alcohol dehydrogenase catalytic domain-containing protein, partial [Nitrospiria bacterium]
MMKAVRFHAFGGPEQLIYEDAPKPVAGPGEAVVRVAACALNHLDLWIRKGIPAYRIELPHISGCDVSGIVDETGEGVEGIVPGQRVFIAPGLSCFECPDCLSGNDHLCATYRILGAGPDGGYAEYVKAPAKNIIPIPDTLSFEAVAAFPLTFLTAWHMLISRASVRPGQDVLVLAGGSGVGSAA